MRAASHMEGHALRAAEGPYDALRPNTGITDVDEGVAWALARTFGLVSEHSSAALTWDRGRSPRTPQRHSQSFEPPKEHKLCRGMFASSEIRFDYWRHHSRRKPSWTASGEADTIESNLLPLAAGSY